MNEINYTAFRKKRTAVFAVLILLLCNATFSYIARKADVASFTHDESFSYNHYVHNNFMDIISNEQAFSNNHLLNTLGMKYSEILFGSSEFALRLPNLIMLIVFFLYLFLLLGKIDRWLCLTAFILVCSSTMFIDFFGMARGYGMSIGFMTASLYHMIRSFNSHANKHLVFFNLCALMAILSNFTMLDFWVAALLVFNFMKYMESRLILKERFNLFKANKMNILLLL